MVHAIEAACPPAFVPLVPAVHHAVMKTCRIVLPYVHDVDVLEPRARKPRRHRVRAEAAFDLEDCPRAEARTVCVLERRVPGLTSRYESFDVEGRLYSARERDGTSEGGAWDHLDLVPPSMDASRGTSLSDLSTEEEVKARRRGMVRGVEVAARTTWDDAAVRLQAAREDYPTRFASVAGTLLPRVSMEPCWRVVALNGLTVVTPTFVPDFLNGALHFRADRLDDAMRAAAATRSSNNQVVISRDDIEVVDPALLRFDVSVLRALRIRQRLAAAAMATGRDLLDANDRPQGWSDGDEPQLSALVAAVATPDHARDRAWAARTIAVAVSFGERNEARPNTDSMEMLMGISGHVSWEKVFWHTEDVRNEDPAMASDVEAILNGDDPLMDEADMVTMAP